MLIYIHFKLKELAPFGSPSLLKREGVRGRVNPILYFHKKNSVY
jgi:hypothetical protein